MKEIVNKLGQTEKEFLKNYDSNKYEKPSVTVDMLIFTVDEKENENYRKLNDKELKILLIKRADHPYIGQWGIPGGFVGMNETLDDAAQRELYEETNIKDVYLEQLYTWGDVERDPRMRVISTSYMALVNKDLLDVKAGDDACDAKWFSVNKKVLSELKKNTNNGYILETRIELILKHEDIILKSIIKKEEIIENKIRKTNIIIEENDGIAFDHSKIIDYALDRLKNKVQYTDIAFNLMPDLFTLAELQQVYSILLDRELLTPQFRRDIKHMLIETNETTKNFGHRPAKLYRFNIERKGV